MASSSSDEGLARASFKTSPRGFKRLFGKASNEGGAGACKVNHHHQGFPRAFFSSQGLFFSAFLASFIPIALSFSVFLSSGCLGLEAGENDKVLLGEDWRGWGWKS